VRRKIRAIEDGLYQPSMKARMAELETDKAALEERLAPAPEPPKVRLHPNLAGVYRQKVAALEQALADPLDKAEAAEMVRGQIGRMTLTPGAGGGLDVVLHGDLARILQFCAAGERTSERPRTNVPGRG
jgi:site-specific DNA recombinase